MDLKLGNDYRGDVRLRFLHFMNAANQSIVIVIINFNIVHGITYTTLYKLQKFSLLFYSI